MHIGCFNDNANGVTLPSKHSTHVKLLVALLETVIEIAILFTCVGPKNLYRKYTSPKITV